MWLNDAEYPSADARLPVGVLEWIQYQLDTAGSVADVLASDARVRIQGQIPLHYLVSDRTGAAATIEYLEGRLVARAGDTLPAAVLANETYASSLAFTNARRGQTPSGSGSHERFARVYASLPEIASGGDRAIDRAFDTLRDVAQRNTRWSIVYDQTRGEIHWRTDAHAAVRSLRMSSLDFSCASAPLSIDVNAPMAGDVRAHLTPLTPDANAALIEGSTRKTSFTRHTAASEVASQARYGFSPSCAS